MGGGGELPAFNLIELPVPTLATAPPARTCTCIPIQLHAHHHLSMPGERSECLGKVKDAMTEIDGLDGHEVHICQLCCTAKVQCNISSHLE